MHLVYILRHVRIFQPLTVVSHFILILGPIVVTVATFKVSENVYRFKTVYHSPDSSKRVHVYYSVHNNAYRVPLPKNDPTNEHD